MAAANGKIPKSDLAPIAGGWLTKSAAAAWNAMNVEARKNGLQLLPTGSRSSYRTYEEQVYFWNLYQAGKGNLAARPGTSNHGWGLAVDLATHDMRAMLDRVGRKYGWAKAWSDAPSEWWHIRYRAGVWSGKDPGPTGVPPPPKEPERVVSLQTVRKNDGRLVMFAEDVKGGVWSRGQNKAGNWTDTTWQSLGKP